MSAETDSDATIDRRPLSQKLSDRLRTMILDGDLAPGERLQEKDLSERFGVSRTPLREALKVLSSEGLVTLAPNRGATVTDLAPDEVAETYPVMGALEALAGELACAHATDAEIDAIARLHRDLIHRYEARDLQGYFVVNEEIHRSILAAARNATLSRHYNQLAGRVSRARYRVTMTETQWATAVKEHETMLAALKARDGKRMAEVMRTHVVTKHETVRSVL